MKLTTKILKQIVKEELMREGDVVQMFPYKVTPKSKEGYPMGAASFTELEAAVKTAKVWHEMDMLDEDTEKTSPEVLDVVYRDWRDEREEMAIKRAGPAPPTTDKEHADYMSLYDPEDIEPLREMLDPETMTVIQGFAKVIDNFGAATYPALAAMFAMSVKEVADTVRSYAAKKAGVNIRKR